jgi:hypothetical protein
MNTRVATVLNPKRLANMGSLSLTNQTRKIAKRNFEVQVKTEFQLVIPRWLVSVYFRLCSLIDCQTGLVSSQDVGGGEEGHVIIVTRVIRQHMGVKMEYGNGRRHDVTHKSELTFSMAHGDTSMLAEYL